MTLPLRRLHSSVLALLFSVQHVFATTTIDVSGDRGTDGNNGRGYSGSAASGQDGRDAGHASEPTEGLDAGAISVSLKSQSTDGSVVLQGTYVDDNGRSGKINERVYMTSGSVFLNARGGNGGDGAYGGNGEDGGNGRDGVNATKYTAGTDGQNGGRGGDGGRGTSGARGGRGGTVEINVNEADMDLLMIVEHNISGGNGGQAGRHGSAGEGGRGGSGGREYVWYEKVPDGKDDEGKQKYKEIKHVVPGGSDGYRGSNGSYYNSELNDGAWGKDGKFVINVKGENGKNESYSSRYDLRVEDYSLETDDKDGVVEPGEKVYLRNLRIRNTGGMPTPTKTKIKLFLTNTKYGIAEPIELMLEQSIKAGETFTFKSPSQFVLKINELLKDIGEEPISWSDETVPVAELLRVNRTFNSLSSARTFEITYPIKFEPITYFKSIAPGEKYRVTFKLTNISNQDFGSASAVQRQVQLFIQQQTGSNKDIQILGLDGKPWDLTNGTLQALAHLKKQESVLVEGVIYAPEAAEPNSDNAISIQLGLDKFSTPGKIEQIQKRMLDVHITEIYKRSKDSQVLIMADPASQKKQVESIRKELAKLSIKADIWDLGYYGSISLLKSLASDSTLANDFKDKNVVILSDEFTTPVGTVSALQLKRTQEIVKMLTVYGASVTVMGKDADKFGDGVTLPIGIESKGSFTSMDQILRSIRVGDKEKLMESRARDITTFYKEFVFKPFLFFGKPSEETLERKANQLSRILTARYPDRNYVVSYEFSPKVIKTGGFLGLGKRWVSGAIQVRRSLDLTQGALVTVDTDSQDNATEVKGKLLARALSFGNTFTTKLGNLKVAMVRGNKAQLDYLVDSIVFDLVLEQIKLRRTPTAIRMYKDETTKAMPLLTQLLESDIVVNTHSSDEAIASLLKIVNSVERISKGLVPWWERFFIPFRTNKYAAAATVSMAKKIKSQLIVQSGIFSRRENSVNAERLRAIEARVNAQLDKEKIRDIRDLDEAEDYVRKLMEGFKSSSNRPRNTTMEYSYIQNERERRSDENKQVSDLEKQLQAARDDLKGAASCSETFKTK